MTDKELIKQEIERQLYCGLYSIDAKATLQNLYTFIDSIPEEHNNDLEKEIGLYTTNSLLKKRNHDTGIYHLTQNDCDSIARHFAEWQKERDYLQYSHISLKDIKDAWQTLKKNKPDIESYPPICFVKGAEWQKQQMKEALQTEYEKGRFDMREEMMKDAAEAFVNTYENTDDSNYVEFVTEQSPYKFKETEKCKLIIVKEE